MRAGRKSLENQKSECPVCRFELDFIEILIEKPAETSDEDADEIPPLEGPAMPQGVPVTEGLGPNPAPSFDEVLQTLGQSLGSTYYQRYQHR